MKQLSVLLPPYAPDYGGACSVLYELGGLIIIHDAAGCTVNYTTYDEPRWMERPGPVYCSGLRELDAVLGDDEKVIQKALDAARQLNPRFLAIAGSSVPMIIGTDLQGIARELEARSGLPAFGFDTTGISLYDQGAAQALSQLLARFAQEAGEVIPESVNLLGLTPLDYNTSQAALTVRARFEGAGFQVLTSLSMGCRFEELALVPRAALNVVLSSSGLEAARQLKARFGTPYLVGAPAGTRAAERLFERARLCMASSQDFNACAQGPAGEGGLLILGECVTSGALRSALEADYGLSGVTVGNLYTAWPELVRPGDVHLPSEPEVVALVNSGRYRTVVGDPMLRAALRPESGVKFIPLPSTSVSGGIYQRSDAPGAFEPEGLAPLARRILDTL